MVSFIGCITSTVTKQIAPQCFKTYNACFSRPLALPLVGLALAGFVGRAGPGRAMVGLALAGQWRIRLNLEIAKISPIGVGSECSTWRLPKFRQSEKIKKNGSKGQRIIGSGWLAGPISCRGVYVRLCPLKPPCNAYHS